MPETKSSVYFSIAFSHETASVLRDFAQTKGVGVNNVIRNAVYQYLRQNGIYVEQYNPKTRGERTDLKTLSASESRARLNHLFSTRKHKI